MGAQVGVNFEITIDPLAIGQAIANAINLGLNRGAFVHNLAETAFFHNGQRYNALAVNMGQHPQTGSLSNIVFYGSATYGDGTIYGIWCFTSGEFTHDGDGGYENWAMKGWFDRDGDGGRHVIFRAA